jgi:hypothetical protein
MKSKIFILIFCTTLASCTKQNSIQDVFYSGSDEYWQYYTGNYSGPVYFKFNKNNTSDYVDIEKDKFIIMKSEGDIELKPVKWSVSKDTILTWGINKYDIVSYNDKLIILYNQGRNEANGKMESGFIYLVKGTIDNVRREPGYFGYKRELYPEKYRKK